MLMLRRQVPGPGGPFITVGRIGRVDCERCSMFRAVAVFVVVFSTVADGGELSLRDAILFLDFRDGMPTA